MHGRPTVPAHGVSRLLQPRKVLAGTGFLKGLTGNASSGIEPVNDRQNTIRQIVSTRRSSHTGINADELQVFPKNTSQADVAGVGARPLGLRRCGGRFRSRTGYGWLHGGCDADPGGRRRHDPWDAGGFTGNLSFRESDRLSQSRQCPYRDCQRKPIGLSCPSASPFDLSILRIRASYPQDLIRPSLSGGS